MIKKILIILAILGFSFCFFIFKVNPDKNVDTFYIEQGLENETLETFLVKDFENNSELTVGQLLVFYSRLFGNNVSTFQEAQEFCELKNIYLPSDLVYDEEAWEELWRNIVLGNTVFEKKNENTYAINLIPGYLTIYLNEQGYKFVKQGLIPPQLYFYSPFSGIKDLEEINLNKKANLGFVFYILMSVECNEGNKKEILHDIISEKIELLTGKSEDDWTDTEISLYNYYSLSYYGEYIYLKEQGYIEEMDLSNLALSVKVSDFMIMINRIVK